MLTPVPSPIALSPKSTVPKPSQMPYSSPEVLTANSPTDHAITPSAPVFTAQSPTDRVVTPTISNQVNSDNGKVTIQLPHKTSTVAAADSPANESGNPTVPPTPVTDPGSPSANGSQDGSSRGTVPGSTTNVPTDSSEVSNSNAASQPGTLDAGASNSNGVSQSSSSDTSDNEANPNAALQFGSSGSTISAGNEGTQPSSSGNAGSSSSNASGSSSNARGSSGNAGGLSGNSGSSSGNSGNPSSSSINSQSGTTDMSPGTGNEESQTGSFENASAADTGTGFETTDTQPAPVPLGLDGTQTASLVPLASPGLVLLGSSTLSAGSAAVTTGGHVVSVASNGAIQVDGQYAWKSLGSSGVLYAMNQPIATAAGMDRDELVGSAAPGGGLVVGSTTLSAGGAAETVNGYTISAGSSGAVLVNGATVTSVSAVATSSSSSGMAVSGDAITSSTGLPGLSAFGLLSAPPQTLNTAASTTVRMKAAATSGTASAAPATTSGAAMRERGNKWRVAGAVAIGVMAM